jgi:tripartite-type tricarboxylate transporter receptor subunit TctC
MPTGDIARYTAFACAGLIVAAAHAQEPPYPGKPIHTIVPFPPGGGTDLLERIVCQKLTENLGQSIVVENRPGAAGVVGADVVAMAKPDRYMMLIVSASHPGFHFVSSGLRRLPPGGYGLMQRIGWLG